MQFADLHCDFAYNDTEHKGKSEHWIDLRVVVYPEKKKKEHVHNVIPFQNKKIEKEIAQFEKMNYYIVYIVTINKEVQSFHENNI